MFLLVPSRHAAKPPYYPKTAGATTLSAKLSQHATSANNYTSGRLSRRVGSSSPAGLSSDTARFSCSRRLLGCQTGIQHSHYLRTRLCSAQSQGQHKFTLVLQALVTRELEEAAKTLGDRVRQKDATCEVSGWMLSTGRLPVDACSAPALVVAFATFWLAAGMFCIAATSCIRPCC